MVVVDVKLKWVYSPLREQECFWLFVMLCFVWLLLLAALVPLVTSLLLLSGVLLTVRGEEVGVGVVEVLLELASLPQVGCEELVGLGDGEEGGLGEVAEGGGVARRRREHVLDTGELEHLLGDLRGDEAGTLGGGDEAHADRAALAGHLDGDGVGLADEVTPVTTPHGHDGQLREDDGGTDGGGHFLGALDTETDVA